MPAMNRKRRRRLLEMDVSAVSIVDKAANLRTFLIYKRQEDKTVADIAVERLEEIESTFSESISKGMDDAAKKAVASSIALMTDVRDKLPESCKAAFVALEKSVTGDGTAVEEKKKEEQAKGNEGGVNLEPIQKTLAAVDGRLAAIEKALADLKPVAKPDEKKPDTDPAEITEEELDEALDAAIDEYLEQGGEEDDGEEPFADTDGEDVQN